MPADHFIRETDRQRPIPQHMPLRGFEVAEYRRPSRWPRTLATVALTVFAVLAIAYALASGG